MSKLDISVIQVTPQLAAAWLAKNEVNRPIRDRKVTEYASDMAAGRWQSVGDTLRFARNGRLLDGQHRLSAVVASGATVEFIVVKGLANEAQGDMDTGAKRSASDALALLGVEYSALTAAAARLLIRYRGGHFAEGGDTRIGVTNGEIRGFVVNNPELKDAVRNAGKWKSAIDAPPSVIAAAHYVLSGIDPVDAADFFDMLMTRADVPAGSAILALDSRLRAIRRDGIRVDQRDYLSLFFKAWNYYRKNRNVRHLETGGKFNNPL